MKRSALTLASACCLLGAAPAAAAEPVPVPDDWGSDFGTTPVTTPPEPPGQWSGTVTLRTRAGLWLEKLDETPLASLRTSADGTITYAHGAWRLMLSGHAEVDPAFMLQRDDFDGPTYDAYAALVDIRKTYVSYAGALGDVTLGWQIVPWGEALMLGALDVVNPRDLREPGLADLEDMRLPVLSTRLGLGAGVHRVELLWVHEASFGYRSPPLGPHSLYRAFLPPDAVALAGERDLVIRDTPARWSLDAQQLFLRWMVRGAGFDLGLYAAWALDQRGVPGELDALAAAQADSVAFPLEHQRYWLFGTSGVVPFETVLLKWELGVYPDKPLTALSSRAGASSHNVRRVGLDAFASLVWDPSPENQLALEWQTLFLIGGDSGDEYLLHPEVPRMGLRFAHRALSERLLLELLLLVDADFGGVLTAMLRGSLDYQLSDGWRCGLGGIAYWPSQERTGPLAAFDRNNQVFVRLRWDFALP